MTRIRTSASFVRATRAGCAAAALLACLPAAAQSTIEPANEWRFEFTPYVWLAGLRSELRLGALPTDVFRANSTSMLEALDFAAMGALDARKGNAGVLLDAMYIRAGVSNPLPGAAFASYDLRIVQQTYTMAGYYRVLDAPSVSLDLLGGARYSDVDTTFGIDAPFRATPQLQESAGWWNGIVGVRALLPINDRWQLMGYLDGGEGNRSRTLQAIAGLNYAYSPMVTIKFGYRYFDLSRRCDCNGLLKSVELGGAYVGAGFKF